MPNSPNQNNTKPKSSEGIQQLPLSLIDTNPKQPRKFFAKESLQELASSIKNHGLMAPLVVRPQGSRYELIAGERRFRALRELKREQAPVFIRKVDTKEALELSLIENIQRDNLNPIEIAFAYQVMSEDGLDQNAIAERVGKSRSGVSNQLRLLKLPETVRAALVEGELEMGHARALLGLESQQQMIIFAGRIINEGLSVRQAEALVGGARSTAKTKKRESAQTDPNIRALEERFSHALGTTVAIKKGRKGGKVVINFHSHEDFDRIFSGLLSTSGEDWH